MTGPIEPQTQAPKTQPTIEEAYGTLPLIVEVIPGQGAAGISNGYSPADYQGRTVDDVITPSFFDTSKIDDELEQMALQARKMYESGAVKLAGENPIQEGATLESLVKSNGEVMYDTESNRHFLYLPIRLTNPSEGGSQQ